MLTCYWYSSFSVETVLFACIWRMRRVRGIWIEDKIYLKYFGGTRSNVRKLKQFIIFSGHATSLRRAPGASAGNDYSDTHLRGQHQHEDLGEYQELQMTSSHCCASQDHHQSPSTLNNTAGELPLSREATNLNYETFLVKRRRQTDHESEISTVVLC